MLQQQLLYNESELLLKVSQGDRQAFTRLYSTYLNPVINYILPLMSSREEAEELIQDIFVSLWEKRESLYQVDSFQAYLFRSARNRYFTHLQRLKTQEKIYKTLFDSQNLQVTNADNKVLLDDYYRVATAAINKLPARQREIFLLRTETGLSLDEITTRLGISKSAVKNQLYAAISFVRSYLEQHGISALTLILLVNDLLKK